MHLKQNKRLFSFQSAESSYFGLCSLLQNVVVGRWRRWMLPQHRAVWEFIINLLSHRDICEQHELLHH